jgi:NRPS condensation-like uncharacterized protein
MEGGDSGQERSVSTTTDALPFTALDEAVHHLDTPHEPWSIQLEVRVDGALDADRLRRAVAEGIARHPMARTRRLPARRSDRGYSWEVRPEPDVDPFRVVECPDDDRLAQARADLYSVPVPVVEAPPLRVRLARSPGGDVVMVNANHAAFDGFGAVRVLQSVARAYTGEDDPPPPVDLSEARDLARHLAAPDTATRVGRWRALVDKARDLASPPARLAPDGGRDRPGYGFHHVTVPRVDHSGPGTVNDLLLAALNLAVEGWNTERGVPCERISVLMPVNLRPKDWFTDVVTNFVVETRVATMPADRSDPTALLEAVAAQTERIKQRESGALMEVLTRSSRLPLWAKRPLPAVLSVTGNRLVDTAVLSNLGSVGDPPSFGAGCETTELWFSAPARMPCGLSVGVATLGGRMHLSFRYRHPLWDAAAAGRFAARYLDEVGRLAVPKA